jgi:hypothetical protein
MKFPNFPSINQLNFFPGFFSGRLAGPARWQRSEGKMAACDLQQAAHFGNKFATCDLLDGPFPDA